MKALLLLPALLLFGCAPASQVTEAQHRGYTAAGQAGAACPGGRSDGEAWCAPCHVLAGSEPQVKQNVCENGRVVERGPCVSTNACKAPAPAPGDAKAALLIYDIDAPDRGCNRPGEGGRAAMLLNRGDKAVSAVVRSAQTAPQTVSVARHEQLRLGCVKLDEQATNWTVVSAEWAP